MNANVLDKISDLRRNIARELDSLQFPNPMDTNGFQNRHHKEEALWQAAISAGLYPNVATRRMGEVNFSTMTNRKAKIHVSSVNAVKGQVSLQLLSEFLNIQHSLTSFFSTSRLMRNVKYQKGRLSFYALVTWSSK